MMPAHDATQCGPNAVLLIAEQCSLIPPCLRFRVPLLHTPPAKQVDVSPASEL